MVASIVKRIDELSIGATKEVCGIVTTTGEVIPIDNISSNKDTFIFDKRQWYGCKDAYDIEFIYHTHLNGDTSPSLEDLITLRRLGYSMLIVSNGKWRLIENA